MGICRSLWSGSFKTFESKHGIGLHLVSKFCCVHPSTCWSDQTLLKASNDGAWYLGLSRPQSESYFNRDETRGGFRL